MGIFQNILTNNIWSKRLLKRGLDISDQSVDQSTGKVMASQSSPEATYTSPLLYHSYTSITAMNLSAVYAAISLISNAISCIPIYVKQQKDNEKTIVKNSRIQKLFYNMLQSKHIVIKQLVIDLLLYGNAYVYIKRVDGKPEKLIYMQHGDVQIDYKKQEDKVQYLCSNHKSVPSIVPQDDMLHFAKDTIDGIQGRGFLIFAKDVIDLAGFTMQAASDYFSSGCNLTGLLQFSGRLRDEQKAAIRQQWMQIHGTGSRSGGLGIIEGDSQYIPISQNSSDAQLLDTRAYNVEEIARFFNINPVLLGDLSHSSYNDIEQAQLEFIQHTLLPIIDLFQEECNRKLITVTNQYIDFDETYLLKGNMSSMSGYYTSLVSNGIITIDEAREKLGWNPFNDGYSDKILIPFTKISDNVINQDNNQDENNETDDKNN